MQAHHSRESKGISLLGSLEREGPEDNPEQASESSWELLSENIGADIAETGGPEDNPVAFSAYVSDVDLYYVNNSHRGSPLQPISDR